MTFSMAVLPASLLRVTPGVLGLLGAMHVTSPAAASAHSTLSAVQDLGVLRCGVTDAGVGLSEVDAAGSWQGFFVDFCRAFGAAVAGDPEATEIVQLNSQVRFEAVAEGAVDVLATNATWTLTRDTSLGIAFPSIYYYDGQGFMAHQATGASLEDVDQASVCVTANTTTESNLLDYIDAAGKDLTPVTFRATAEMFSAFFNRRCDLMTTDRIALAAQRVARAADPQSFVIFPDIISKEPLAVVTRNDDAQWQNVIKWIVLAMIIAEEKGVTSENIETMTQSSDAEVRRLLGLDPGMGESLGLDEKWAYRAIASVGNYGEVFNRHIGPETPIGLERGLNALWRDGGLLYAPPLR